MTDAVAGAEDPPKKSSKLTLIIGLVLALAGAGGGFFAVQSGILFSQKTSEGDHQEMVPDSLPDIAFVPLDPIIVSLTDERLAQHLRFRAHLEVQATYQDEVELLSPRIIDVLNGYLRALEPKDFRDPLALTRLRAQMLRRVQIVAGEGRIMDILIMEFVLN